MASICCSPPESRPARWCARSAQDREQLEHALARALALARVARGHSTGAQVLLDRQVPEDLPPFGDLDEPAPRDLRRVEPEQAAPSNSTVPSVIAPRR